MNVEIKITSKLYRKIHHDLERPHQHALERVGFLSSRTGKISDDTLLILFTDYHAVPDENYIFDPTVGARIDADSIRTVMQRILDISQEGAFHVHMHPYWPAMRLEFSKTDDDSQNRMIHSFQSIGPDRPHGTFLFDGKRAIADIWLPNQKSPIRASKISIIGYPTQIYKETSKCRKIDTIDSRSSAIKTYLKNAR